MNSSEMWTRLRWEYVVQIANPTFGSDNLQPGTEQDGELYSLNNIWLFTYLPILL